MGLRYLKTVHSLEDLIFLVGLGLLVCLEGFWGRLEGLKKDLGTVWLFHLIVLEVGL